MTAATFWLTEPLMRDEAIWRAQRLLAENGFAVKADGIFGAATSAALRAFQRRRGLAEDGVLGPLSWAALQGATPPAPPALPDLAALALPHARYPGGVPWRVTREGVTREDEALAPSGAERRLAAQLLARHGATIAALRSPVPAELILATIATESGGDARAIRQEPGCDAADPARTPHRVSAGLMQTLLSTAREALRDPALKLEALCSPVVSIRAGAEVIARQSAVTRYDPPLVACAYNAGGLYFQGSPANPWRLRQYPIGTGAHADRFCRFFNAALAAVRAAPVPGPSFAALLP
jgi:hypothetical protein